MPEIRKNLITGEYVIMAPERAKRPEDFLSPAKGQVLPAHSEGCPFCPGNEAKTPPETYRFPEGDNAAWKVRCIPNRFSALDPTGELWKKDDGLKTSMAGVGLHEVIIETTRHDLCLPQLAPEDVESVFKVYHHRFRSFYADPRVEHVILFKNHGASAGTSLEHPHSQIVGLPMAPVQVRHRAEDSMRFCSDEGCCLVCRTIEDEMTDAARVITETENFVAFIPYAALSPFHTWVMPKRHSGCFGETSGPEVLELAALMRTVLGKIHKGLDNPDFNYVIRSGSPSESGSSHLHWYMAIVPRVTKAAGFELGTGMYINPSIPERSAEFLRNVVV